MSEFLLEVGTEEIPDWMIPGALADFERRFREALAKCGLGAGVSTTTEATARRLALFRRGLARGTGRPPRDSHRPAAARGFRRRRQPRRKAGEGVCAQGRSPPSPICRSTKKENCSWRERSRAARPADILAQVLPQVILSISLPPEHVLAGQERPALHPSDSPADVPAGRRSCSLCRCRRCRRQYDLRPPPAGQRADRGERRRDYRLKLGRQPGDSLGRGAAGTRYSPRRKSCCRRAGRFAATPSCLPR